MNNHYQWPTLSRMIAGVIVGSLLAVGVYYVVTTLAKETH